MRDKNCSSLAKGFGPAPKLLFTNSKQGGSLDAALRKLDKGLCTGRS